MTVNLGECEDPGVPTNGMRLSEWFKFGDVVKFYCDPGYEMVGASVVQCIITKRSDGHAVHWNESTPTCVSKYRRKMTGGTLVDGYWEGWAEGWGTIEEYYI